MEKVGHDLKSDAIVLARHGVTVAGLGFDTMLASYLLDATRAPHALETLALEHLGYKALTEEDVCGKGAKAMAAGGPARRRRRSTTPASAPTCRCSSPSVLRGTLDAEGLDRGLPRARAAAGAGPGGARAGRRPRGHRRARGRCRQPLEREMQARSARIFELAGETFNINSPKQLGEVLFEKLKLPVLKRPGTTRAASTAVEVLEELALVARPAAPDPRVARRCRS